MRWTEKSLRDRSESWIVGGGEKSRGGGGGRGSHAPQVGRTLARLVQWTLRAGVGRREVEGAEKERLRK